MIIKYKLLFISCCLSVSNNVLSANNPSLFFNLDDIPQIKNRIENTEWLSGAFNNVLDQACIYLQTPTNPYVLTYDDVGIGTAGRAVQHRLATLAMAGYITGDQKYLSKGKEILLAIVRQTESDTHKHWIKHLQSADAAQGIAYGYDFYGHLLTPDEDIEVREYLEKIGQTLIDEDTTWGKPAPGVTSCNHNSVHFGALGLVALSLGDKPDWLALACKRVRAFYENFIDETGYATEGHSYLGYGMAGAFPFSYALKRKTDEVLWDSQPAFKHVGDQILWKLLPFDGEIVAMNDAVNRATDPAGILTALMYSNGAQLWAWLNSLERYEDVAIQANGNLRSAHAGHLLFLVGDKPTEPIEPAKANIPLGHRFESGRVFLRSSWEGEDAAHFGFTSGYDFHRGHNHHDENSLTFAALGEAFLIDPGFGLGSPKQIEHHTSITANGAALIDGGRGRIVDYREDEYGAFVYGQAEEAYDFQAALVGYADRKAYFVRGPKPYLVWRDDMSLESDVDAKFSSYYISDKDNELTKDGKSVIIKGKRGKANCLLQAYAMGTQVDVEIDNASKIKYKVNGKIRLCKNYFKRSSVIWTGRNPRLVSIAMPFYTKNELPQIAVNYNKLKDEVGCELVFPDGNTDVLVFGVEDVYMKRKTD